MKLCFYNDNLLSKNEKLLGDNLNLYGALVLKNDFSNFNLSKQILGRLPFLYGNALKAKTYELLESLDSKYKKDNFLYFRNLCAQYIYVTPTCHNISKISKYIDKSHIPLPVIRVLSHILSNDREEENNLICSLLKISNGITDCQQKSLIKFPLTVHKLLVEQNAYVTGCIAGDGCNLASERTLYITDGSLQTKDLIYSKIFLKNIGNIFFKIFHIKYKVYKSKNQNAFILVIWNKWLPRFFSFFFDIPFGAKLNLIEPKIFELSPNKDKLISLFWRGCFDTDGHVKKCSLSFTSKHLSFLRKFALHLKQKDINVNFTKTRPSILINTASIGRFAKEIGISHPRKQKILVKSLSEGSRIRICKDMNKEKLYKNYFDLLQIKGLRIIGCQDLISNWRRKLNVSQEYLAKKFGVTQVSIGNWERGNCTIPLNLLFKLGEMVEYNKSEFYKLLDKRKPLFMICEYPSYPSGYARLPIRIDKSIVDIASFLLPQPKSNRTKIFKRKMKNISYKELKKEIKRIFKVDVIKISDSYVIHNLPIKEFFNTYFIYESIRKKLIKQKVQDLVSTWNKVFYI